MTAIASTKANASEQPTTNTRRAFSSSAVYRWDGLNIYTPLQSVPIIAPQDGTRSSGQVPHTVHFGGLQSSSSQLSGFWHG